MIWLELNGVITMLLLLLLYC